MSGIERKEHVRDSAHRIGYLRAQIIATGKPRKHDFFQTFVSAK